jgi:hypothetical protein
MLIFGGSRMKKIDWAVANNPLLTHEDILRLYCPSNFDLIDNRKYCYRKGECKKCWEGEIDETPLSKSKANAPDGEVETQS